MNGFKKAERTKVKIKLAMVGPSGSGKTYSSLLLAKGLGSKIAVLDTENDSSQLYAGCPDIPDFDSMTLAPPFTSERYIKSIQMAVKLGYDVLIIDSVTHQWNGEGGIMDRIDKEKMAKPSLNSYTLWAKYTPEHERFKQAIVQCPIHLIATIRSKSDYVLSDTGNGKLSPKKVGMAPIQRDQFEYEFTTMFDISMEHYASVSKDRTNLFDGQTFKIDESIGVKIMTWLSAAKEKEINIEKPKVETEKPVAEEPPKAIVNHAPTPITYDKYVFKNGTYKDKKFSDIEPDILDAYMGRASYNAVNKELSEESKMMFALYELYKQNRTI